MAPPMAFCLMTGRLEQVGTGIAGPPYKMRQNETTTWQDTPYNDRFYNTYDSNSYQLQYAFAGAGTPQILTAVPGTGVGDEGLGGGGWTTTFSPIQSAAMTPGQWWWQAILTGFTSSFQGSISGNVLTIVSGLTGTVLPDAGLAGAGIPAGVTIVSGSGTSWIISETLGTIATEAMATNLANRIVAGEGEMLVEQDLSSLTGVADLRSTMEIGLANCEAALLVFQTSGGRIREYTIGQRRMVFQNDEEIRKLADWFRARVFAQRASASGGQRRMIRIGFSPPSSGIPTSNSKNWPWW